MIGGISFSATSVTSGLDIDKPVNPRPGHQYLATDTKKQYNCYVAGVWVDSSRVTAGNYADRPINPSVGDIYICKDGKGEMVPYMVVCLSQGVWSNPNLPISVMTSGTKVVLATDIKVYSVTGEGGGYIPIKQYTVE